MKTKNKMHLRDKTKDELINELQKLQQEYDLLKTSHEKEIAGRKKIEEVLKFTRFMLDNAADTMVCVKKDGRLIDVNNAFCSTVDYSREELLSMTVHDIDPNYPARTWPGFWEKLKQAGSLTFESYHCTKDGKLTLVEVIASFFEHNGEEYHCGIARDITERKKAEEALRENEEKLKVAQEIGRIGTWEFDIESQKIIWSDQAYKLYDRNPALGPPSTEEEAAYYAPEQYKTLLKYANSAIKEGKSFEYDLEAKLPGGRKVYFFAKMQPVKNAYGQVTKLFGTVQDITERRQAEEALQESEERYRRLVEGSPDAIAVHSKGKFVFVNPAGAKLIGAQSPQELIGSPILNVVHPDSRSEVIDRLRHVAEGKEAPLFEEKFVKFDGSVIDVEVVGIPFTYQGQIATQVVVRDITGRKRAEEALQQSEERYRNLFETASDSIFIVDRTTGNIIDANPAASKLYGYSNEEFLRLKSRDVSAEQEKTEAAVSDGITQVALRFHRRKDGTIFPVEITGSYYTQGERKIHTAFIRDITERMRAEEQLQESKNKFQALVETTSDFIWEVDLNGVYTYCSPQIEKLWGFKPEEMLGKTPLDLLTPEDREQAYKAFSASSESKSSFLNMEMHSLDSSGQVKFLEINGVPFLDDTGKLYGFRGITRDITERKQAEEELRESEEQYRQLIDNMGEGVGIIDKEENFVFANPAAEKIFGVGQGGLVGTALHRFLSPENLELVIKQTNERQKRISSIYEHEIILSSGDKKDIIITATPKLGRNGEFLGTFAIFRDITKRRQAEKALLLEKENFRHSLDDSPLGVRIVTAEGNTIYANEAILNIYGYDSLGELQKTPLKKRYTPESYTEAQKRKQQRKGGDLSATSYEISIVRKNGEIRHLQVFRKEVLWDGIRQFQILYDDITDRKRAEEKIKESQNYMDFFFRQSLEGIYFTAIDDPLLWDDSVDKEKVLDYAHQHQIITNVNDAFLAQYGVSKEDVIGKPVSIFFEHDREQGRRGRRELFDKGRMHLVTTEKQKDGSEIWIEGEYMCMYDEKGRITGTFGAQRNITERKQAEEEIRKSKKLLEDLYKHLNDIRENERALIAREIHDQIGQSLTALKLDINRIQEFVGSNPEAFALLRGMIELVTNTIKDVQRISSDLRPGILDDLGLVSAIEWYCDEFRERTGIKCNLKLDDSFIGDSQKNLIFFRVLQETLTNVIRHASASSVNIKLLQSDRGTTLTIQDNGIGIPKEKIESHKSLGLINMRERVKQFNGKIDFSSKKGEGTKLTIFIPS